MHRYKIFLITGETVEVEAKSVKFMIDDQQGHVNRYDFIKDESPICSIKPSAIFYCEYIMGWVQLPESEEVEK